MMKILNAAPPWKADRSEYIILWHGCTTFDRISLETKGIDLSRCRTDADFGRGFYTTTLERQARQWAWSRYYDSLVDPAQANQPGNRPVVLQFKVRRFGLKPRQGDLDDGIDKLSSLCFVRRDYENDDYWSFVQHCRRSEPGGSSGKRAGVIHDHGRCPGGWYDVVSGPVAAFWEQRVSMDGADQVSFHTRKAIRLLNELLRNGKASRRYLWSPVVR